MATFQHALIVALQALAEKLEPLGIACLFPSIVSFEGAPIFEIFILRDGHVVPARSLIARERGPRSDEAWLPPVFDIAGTRVAVSFDLARDMESLPVGTDLVILSFPAYGLRRFERGDRCRRFDFAMASLLSVGCQDGSLACLHGTCGRV